LQQYFHTPRYFFSRIFNKLRIFSVPVFRVPEWCCSGVPVYRVPVFRCSAVPGFTNSPRNITDFKFDQIFILGKRLFFIFTSLRQVLQDTYDRSFTDRLKIEIKIYHKHSLTISKRKYFYTIFLFVYKIWV
jgi:hypothetical protein